MQQSGLDWCGGGGTWFGRWEGVGEGGARLSGAGWRGLGEVELEGGWCGASESFGVAGGEGGRRGGGGRRVDRVGGMRRDFG